MKDNRIDKTGEIKVDYSKGFYLVLYLDKNGMSILSKQKDRLKAFEIAEKFQKKLYAGKLLKEDKSVFK